MKAVKKIGYIALLLMALFVLGACAEAKNEPGTTVDETSDPVENGEDVTDGDDEPDISQVDNVYFVPTSNQLSSTNPEDSVTLTAKVLDQNNILMEGIDVQFAAENDGTLEVTRSTTDSAGSVEAVLTSPNNSTVRDITVTATVETDTEDVSGSIVVSVTDEDAVEPDEARISLAMVEASDGETETSTVTKGESALVTAEVIDKYGQAISGEVVFFFTGLGVLNPGSGRVLTDADGKATIELQAGDTIGADWITASTFVHDSQVDSSRGYEVAAPDVRIGGDSPFKEGTLELGLDTISAGGSTKITARLVDRSDEPIDFPVDVNFSSEFAERSPAGAELDTQVTSNKGVADSTYIALGNETGTDTITATATIGGYKLSASAEIVVLAADAGSIEFISAEPKNIRLKGMGGNETSVVRFRVQDKLGHDSSGQLVNFSLNTSVGGLELEPVSAESDENGEVTTTVQAGTMGTSVRVTAELAGSDPLIQTQSEGLVVSTGIPDQDSFSLSIETFNPEGFNTDGVEVPVTVRLADRFNNPVPDDTAIYFTTEGGLIESSCFTVGSKCSVNWTSQNPRPEWLTAPDPKAPDSPEGHYFPGGGRATILAHAIGEESFLDLTGNGVFDDGDILTGFVDGIFYNYDLPEAFRDDNESGVRDAFEPFIDFNKDGIYNFNELYIDDKLYIIGDELYNGLLCEHSSLCSEVTTIHVRGQGVIVMSTSEAHIEIDPDSISLETGGVTEVTARVWDLNGNYMPAGTDIELSTSDHASIETSTNFTVPNTSSLGPMIISAWLKGDDEPGNGVFTVTVTSPGGVVTENSASFSVTAP